MSNDTVKCGYCGEDIAKDARRCPYCGSLLDLAPMDAQSPVKNQVQEEQKELKVPTVPYDYTRKVVLKDETAIFAPEPSDDPKEEGKPSGPDKPHEPHDETPLPAPAYSSYGAGTLKPLSNGRKVCLTALCMLLPGLGQLIGMILGISYMNDESDSDKKSFGSALLAVSVIAFILTLAFYLLLILTISSLVGGE